MRSRYRRAARALVTLGMLEWGCAAHGAGTGAPTIEVTSVPTLFVHRTVDVDVDFDRFTANLEKLLGRYDPAALNAPDGEREQVLAQFRGMEGEENLVLFQSYRHGSMAGFFGEVRKGTRYNIGNPTYAARMVASDLRSGLYAPLSLIVYESLPGRTRIEYDLPSKCFGQFGNAAVDEIAGPLDGKLERLIDKAARLNDQP